MLFHRRLLPLMLILLCSPCAAQDLIGKLQDRMAENPDAVGLMEASAKTFSSVEQSSFNIVNTIDVVAGEQENTQQQVYAVMLGAEGKYQVELVKPTNEFWVRSNGEQTMTYLQPLSQYSVADEAGGVGAFAASRLASMLGNGFGSLVFSMLDSGSTGTVAETLTDSSYIGEEQVGEQTLHHCRYTADKMSWDAWFTAGDSPRLVRLQPDLKEIASKAPAAKQFDNFSFTMTFEVKDYDAESELPAEAFAMTPPEDADQVEDALSPPEPPPHQLLGQKAPMFDTADPAGAPIDLGGLVGKKVIILDFWATWCGPCVAAMPKLDQVADEYADKGVVLYAVNQGESADTVNAFLEGKNLDVSVAMDPEGAAAQKYSIEGLPTSIVIGKDGRVQVVHVGFSPDLDSKLRGELDSLLAGEDLATQTIDAWNEEHPNRKVKTGAKAN
ncbi:Thiol-disulfide oxidoreductase ResA [Posidoniimonas polymericola]|uniref:Thiol-disulfide oxidoreductase ResA n=1 Tax=Posidoniimonas polymericola TaxID=2528002 RepID=A0A5C5YGD5_9BACT|nr:redoxin family protein [Posidoniimonas polymericola]TWT74440.1 Thiol-disulfide oxidoreductase ResA [Posidoniimonas polymericola]